MNDVLLLDSQSKTHSFTSSPHQRKTSLVQSFYFFVCVRAGQRCEKQRRKIKTTSLGVATNRASSSAKERGEKSNPSQPLNEKGGKRGVTRKYMQDAVASSGDPHQKRRLFFFLFFFFWHTTRKQPLPFLYQQKWRGEKNTRGNKKYTSPPLSQKRTTATLCVPHNTQGGKKYIRRALENVII